MGCQNKKADALSRLVQDIQNNKWVLQELTPDLVLTEAFHLDSDL